MGLTICGFFSDQWLTLSPAVAGQHGHLITRLWGETLKDRGRDVSWYRLLSGLFREQRPPRDPVLADVAGGRDPKRGEAGVRDVSGHQVSGGTELCGRMGRKRMRNILLSGYGNRKEAALRPYFCLPEEFTEVFSLV